MNTNLPWVRILGLRTEYRWHRVRSMSLYKPYITTKCGRHPEGLTEGIYDSTGNLPVGITCRVCVPL